MIGYTTYKILHLVAVLGLFAAVGGVAVYAANGGSKQENAAGKAVSILHGAGLLLILVSGFGLLARLDLSLGGWAIGKLVVWLVAGALLAVPYRSPAAARAVLWLLPALGGVAAWLAISKPF